MDNYLLSRERAQAWFCRFDRQKLAERWGLARKDGQLLLQFLGRPYGVCLETGRVTRLFDGTQADYSETLSIFDLLCHGGPDAHCSGRLAPVNSLRDAPKNGGVGTDFHGSAALLFDRRPEAFRAACAALGGKETAMGDIGFVFPLFGPLTVTLKFYYGDEDFPPSVTLLWDENLLSFVHYETVFYIAGCLLTAIRSQMDGSLQ